jgi:esterase/lipase superfamily enzyme
VPNHICDPSPTGDAGLLALESLRQLYARYGDTVAGRIGAVVFASPDIDMDVFSVRSPARSPSSPRRTIALWHYRHKSPAP